MSEPVALAVAGPDDARHRRSVRLFLIHVGLALVFLALFVWAQVHR